MRAERHRRTTRDADWQRAWSSEIDRRMANVAGERIELIDVDDVHADLRAVLRARRR